LDFKDGSWAEQEQAFSFPDRMTALVATAMAASELAVSLERKLMSTATFQVMNVTVEDDLHVVFESVDELVAQAVPA
jgi:hypothetical protein